MTTSFTNECRIALETYIASLVVDELLANFYDVSVFDGEEHVLLGSSNKKEIMAAMFSTDEDTLHVVKGGIQHFVHFVYGNDGYDVISDYSTSLETMLARPLSVYDKAQEKGGLKITFAL